MPPLPDPTAPLFRLYGPAHLTVILLTFLIPLIFGLLARGERRPRLERAFAITLSALLLLNFFGYPIYLSRIGHLEWTHLLPMQLCDWAMFVIIVALLTHRRAWFDIAYFWGIGGTFQAIITPNFHYGFPDPRFISFFLGHSGIVAGILFLMIARGFRPRPRSIWRTLAWSELYLAITLVVDQLTGVNYGYLLHQPDTPSILDLLSRSRPLYLLELNLVALFFFALLYLPFLVFDLLHARRPEPERSSPHP